MFFIYDNKVYFAPEKDERSHKEWMKELGLGKDYANIVRGVIYEDKLIFFRGNNWQVDEGAEKIFFENIENTAQTLSLSENILVCGGCIVGKIGEVWPPKKVYGKLKILLDK